MENKTLIDDKLFKQYCFAKLNLEEMQKHFENRKSEIMKQFQIEKTTKLYSRKDKTLLFELINGDIVCCKKWAPPWGRKQISKSS